MSGRFCPDNLARLLRVQVAEPGNQLASKRVRTSTDNREACITDHTLR